ncbi:hypothetical protein [Nonomuraea africana]|uniref:Ricin B lectin domain-containing protein n=1 Tax=Nonomuraea africana TaxID=46171 RepID=A0ABR9KJ90_9ACTN|nr:hypothetical protein [Nonomuraea africana]MBE1562081.1 hypothetical protein [Nonomuraea africana]
MMRRHTRLFASLAVAAALPAVTAQPAQAVAGPRTAAAYSWHQLQSATGHCLVPRGRTVKALPCKPGQWLWREVVVPARDTFTADSHMFVYGEGKTVDPDGGTWCLDTNGISEAYMSKCDSNRADDGQLWYPLSDRRVNDYYYFTLVSEQSMGKCKQLVHAGGDTGVTHCPPGMLDKSPSNQNWRFGQPKGEYHW